MKTKYVIELTQTYAVKMAEQCEETQDDSHAEDWSSDRSSEGEDTAEVCLWVCW